MKNKIFLYFFLFIIIVFISGYNKTQKNPPNVVLIMIDDLNDYPEGFNGHPQAKTPNIKKLASSSVSFLKAYSNYLL